MSFLGGLCIYFSYLYCILFVFYILAYFVCPDRSKIRNGMEDSEDLDSSFSVDQSSTDFSPYKVSVVSGLGIFEHKFILRRQVLEHFY